MSTSSRSSRKSFITGVSLESEVVDHFDRFAVQADLSRSWRLNIIVRKYDRDSTRPSV
jgi:hypothetical protein